MELSFVVLPGESKDINVYVDLVGEGAELDLKAMYITRGEEKVNFNILVHHRVPGCRSTQLVKGIAGGNSNVTFNGTIVVAPDAQKTEAFQENHNILLSESAKVETRPQLEIYADDVQCSHGATVGHLDELAQYYMRSRGIPEQEARLLQMVSFLAPVLQHLPSTCRESLTTSVESALRTL